MIQIIIIKVLFFFENNSKFDCSLQAIYNIPLAWANLSNLVQHISFAFINVNASLISHRPYSKTHWVIHSPFLLYFFFEILLVYIWISWRTLQYIHGEVWMRSPKIIHSLSNSKWEEYGVRGSDISLKET